MDFALILDLVVLVILLISCVVAFLRGFVREVLTILGLGGAAMTALIAGPKLAPGAERWLTSGLSKDEIAEKLWGFVPYDIAGTAMSYIGLFVVTLIIMTIISHYVAKAVHAIGLGPVDRSLGIIFGIARGLLLIGLLYMPFHILMDKKDKDEWFGDANTITYVTATSEFVMKFMPESWGKAVEENDEDADPLKGLTGEDADDASDAVGTDEDAADKSTEKTGVGYDDMQRQAIDVLIQNQDKIKSVIDGASE